MTIVSSLPRFCLLILCTLLALSGRAHAEPVVDSLAFSPDGRLLAVGTHGSQDAQITGQELRLYDVKNGRRRWAASSKASAPAMAAFSPDGSRVVLATRPQTGVAGQVTVWEIATRRPVLELTLEKLEQLTALAFSPDGKALMLGTNLISGQTHIGAVKHFDMARGELQQTVLTLEATPQSLNYSSDGTTLVGVMALAHNLSDKGAEVIFWNTADYSIKQRISLGDVAVHQIAFARDLKRAALTTNKLETTEATLVLWDLETQAFTRSAFPADGIVTALHFSPDQKRFIAAGKRMANRQATLWIMDTATGALLREFGLGHIVEGEHPTSFSPDGQDMAIVDELNTIELRSLEDGALIRVFE
jgi:WD40 repeat protein